MDEKKLESIKGVVIKGSLAALEQGWVEQEVTELQSLLECMDCIVERAVTYEKPGLRVFNESVYFDCAAAVRHVCEVLEISPLQAVLLSILVENSSDGSISRSRLASQMGLSFIRTISLIEDFKALKETRLLHINSRGEYRIPLRTLDALAEGRPVRRQEVAGLDTDGILAAIHKLMN